MSDSLVSAFRATVRQRADQPAMVGDEGSYSFADVDAASERAACALRKDGIARGDRVGLYCPNGLAFVACYLGVLKTGAVVVPINLMLGPNEIGFILGDCEAKGLIYHEAFGENARRVVGEITGIGTRYVIGAEPGAADHRFEDLPAQSVAEPAEPTEADLAVILYTSGTTGKPKGAMLTHANLLANTQAVVATLKLTPELDRLLVVLPMFHAFAATVGMLTPLLHGLSLVPMTRFEPAAVCDAIAHHGATVFLGVPSMYAVLLRVDEAKVRAWEKVRFCVSGGAAMPEAVMRAFEERFGVPILEGDGPTECGPVTCVNPVDGPRKPLSVGPPIAGVEMRIVDADGRELPNGEHGEVCVRGPSVMKGYWRLEEATAESFFGDWFRTGDLGWCDEDGWFYLVDRIKDLIIVNGMNVYPRMVEEVLIGHASVAEVAVVGEPHASHGEVPVAHLVAPAGSERPADGEMRDWCRERLGRHQMPRRFEWTDALPRNAAGKVLKRVLRRQGEVERGVDEGSDPG